MRTRAGTSFIVRVHRVDARDGGRIVGIVEMPGDHGALAFGSIEDLGRILTGDRSGDFRLDPDSTIARWLRDAGDVMQPATAERSSTH